MLRSGGTAMQPDWAAVTMPRPASHGGHPGPPHLAKARQARASIAA